MRAQCSACGRWCESLPEWAEHITEMHNGAAIEVERWPDGEPVLVDMTLEPGDFSDGAA